jgi:hypothetical protein
VRPLPPFLLLIGLMQPAVAATDILGNHAPLKPPMFYQVPSVDAERVRQGGDTIGTAWIIPGLPFTDTGTTCGYSNDYDEVCPYAGSTSPDVVYTFTPVSNDTINVYLCTSSYDTKVYVYANSVGNLIACNDDACGAQSYQSRIDALALLAGTPYYIVVDGYNGACGAYSLSVSSRGPCVTCPPGAIQEAEPACGPNYQDTFNGGCNSVPHSFQMIDDSGTGRADVCGKSGTYLSSEGETRDTDWYEVYGTDQIMSATARGEFPMQLVLVWDTYCPPPASGYEVNQAEQCSTAMVSRYIPKYQAVWIWVGPSVFTGVSCESDYLLTITGFTDGCQVTPDSLDFGRVPVGSVADRSFVIKNTTSTTLSGTISESCDAYTIVSGSGFYSLMPGDSVSVLVRFAPQAEGSYPCSIGTGNGVVCGGVACTGVGLGVFSDIGAGLAGLSSSSIAWGDYDNDGDLDILLTGATTGSGDPLSRVYRNDGGVFTDVNAGLPGVYRGSVAWGDYDNDGDLDILLTGSATGLGRISRVYRNDGGIFTDINAGLPGVNDGAVAWADYDNDGDLDILLTGSASGLGSISQVYRNDAGIFTDIGAGLTGVANSMVAWGDYDNDGDLDLVLSGIANAQSFPQAHLYRNDQGTFTEVNTGLPGVADGSLAWGDYDGDGELDLALSGYTTSTTPYIASIFHNAGGQLSDIGAGLPGTRYGATAWADYDSDGDLDLLLIGSVQDGPYRIARVYRNTGGTFTDIGAGLPGVSGSATAWGDCDNDGLLDILLCGYTGLERITRIYRNNTPTAGTPPTAPSALSAQIAGNAVTFHWNASTDGQTPVAGLSYNLRVGNTPGGSEICSPMSDAASGYRRVVQSGNAQQRTSWTMNLPSGASTIYWSVQAVDGSFEGSAFATEQIVTPLFSETVSGLPDIYWGGAAWGDYDSDGDLDVLLAGWTGQERITRIYRNDGGTFTDIDAGLPGVCWGAMAWGDYDGDGDLDVLLTGSTDTGRISRIYRNDGGTFIDIGAGLTGVWPGTVAWGDYDNDGDLDILLAGDPGTGYITRVYRNDGNDTFTDVIALQGVTNCSCAWGDYDNDGDLDILIMGESGVGYITRIYRNTNGAFADIGAGLAGAYLGSVAWGDYDSDGDLDILMTGNDGTANLTKIYRNDGGVFTDVGVDLPAVSSGSTASWGDYDNDGDLDILLTGYWQTGPVSRVYRNDAGSFADSRTALPAVWSSSATWGDYNNDGKLDILLTGQTGTGCLTRIYRSNVLAANTPPNPPGDLAVYEVGDDLLFSWAPATDAQTPSAGLTYNLRIGATPGNSEVMPAMASSQTGYRRVVQLGNMGHRRAWMVHVPTDSCYWSVQAVDGAFAGSAFAPEQMLLVMAGVGGEAALETALLRVVPNPTSNGISVYFALAQDLPSRMEVFDLTGRRIWSWQDAGAGKGLHVVRWDGRDDTGRPVGSGTYYLRFVTPQRSWSRSVLLLR